MGKTTSRILAGALLAASLTGLGAGVAAAQGYATESPNATPHFVDTTDEYGPVNPDDLTRGGLGSPIGDAGQLKIFRP
ncbi:hypothetical protein FOV72_19780 [Gordonia rubripertincta]|uniref:hypothetical protein n=1 Tax=Gordonia rubripertincta TaxID=36822 RepID=UPI001180A6DC|nr:hypothetical protein [Gordonia rubripertincta]TSD93503.1 hypothetical protein FOV72_19780 [Gordonia rubripertincta]